MNVRPMTLSTNNNFIRLHFHPPPPSPLGTHSPQKKENKRREKETKRRDSRYSPHSTIRSLATFLGAAWTQFVSRPITFQDPSAAVGTEDPSVNARATRRPSKAIGASTSRQSRRPCCRGTSTSDSSAGCRGFAWRGQPRRGQFEENGRRSQGPDPSCLQWENDWMHA